MTESQFPEDVQRFILDHITSIEMLEILLFLHGQPERFFSVNEVLSEIQSSKDSIQQRLSQLTDMGLVIQTKGRLYQFSPTPPQLKERVDSLRKCYSSWRLKVIKVIYSRSTDGVKQFSEAFNFRKEK